MGNMFMLVGRLFNIEDDKVTLAVQRPYKNEDGNYESDYITVIIKGSILDNVKQYCDKGDILGIKGHIEDTNNTTELIAEKVTFLSSKKDKDE